MKRHILPVSKGKTCRFADPPARSARKLNRLVPALKRGNES